MKLFLLEEHAYLPSPLPCPLCKDDFEDPLSVKDGNIATSTSAKLGLTLKELVGPFN